MPDHALTEQEALNALRQSGVIEAASITALGEGCAHLESSYPVGTRRPHRA
jgi:hypothetical protein